MCKITKTILVLTLLLTVKISYSYSGQLHYDTIYREHNRPQLHFSPQRKWMNDPNGMVYFENIYHLFFQYYPSDIVWGPMHWGHATSKDLIHWKQLPIALFPDSLGYIFSGSIVVDSNNTSGFGSKGKIPLVAIFTHHNPIRELAGKDDYENQSVAYSLDKGYTWSKYRNNPVLKNPGLKDFRDPKVLWVSQYKKWVMVLAAFDHVTFFSSDNLKDWKKESEFGKEYGAHGGVWECPDLFPLELNGKIYWILTANISPGGPNGGSATQYFVGSFNGEQFVPNETNIKWIDYGPDEYAGVTWTNTGKRKIFLGWMSNWLYANKVPTVQWRNAMTLPRELGLKQVNGCIYVTSLPVKELSVIAKRVFRNYNSYNLTGTKNLRNNLPNQFILDYNPKNDLSYSIKLFNKNKEQLVIGYNKEKKSYFVDRTRSGQTDFSPDFSKISYTPKLSDSPFTSLRIIVDVSSIELFADNGLSVMSCIFFPSKPYDNLKLESNGQSKLKLITITPLKSIWHN